MPEVSVIISAFNAEEFLSDAIDSVLDQTFEDFELIVIDDGSRDGSPDVVKEKASSDERIIFLSNKENIGLAASLNEGLSVSRGQYIARLDADDVALPHRLDKQLETFRTNSNLILCGANVVMTDRYLTPLSRSFLPLEDASIRLFLIFMNPFFHSTVMFRKLNVGGIIEPRYDPNFETAQDYELWTRFVERGKITIVEEPLVLFRRYRGTVSSMKRASQAHNGSMIQRRYLEDISPRLGFNKTEIDEMPIGKERFSKSSAYFSLNTLEKCENATKFVRDLRRRSQGDRRAINSFTQYVISACIKVAAKKILKKKGFVLLINLITRHPISFIFISSQAVKKLFISYRSGGWIGVAHWAFPEFVKESKK